MRTNTQSKILYTRQYLQVCGDAWRVSAGCPRLQHIYMPHAGQLHVYINTPRYDVPK